ncbi:MAG: alpha,4-glucan:alpha,4-glucan 6-glycosyltransferase [Nitrospirae bacterium]|nr:alpha,4-glucan:alpha,4-glucan 6-glycosyltransferase [Nitrospirota bacterium]
MGLQENIRRIVAGKCDDPFSILGMHLRKDKNGTDMEVREFLPEAEEAWIVDDETGRQYPMEKIHKKGFYLLKLNRKKPFPYHIKIRTPDGSISQRKDPYAFGRILTDYDLHLIGEGNHYKKYEKLGAHVIGINGVSGVHFAVWAPNAASVSVTGDFNDWDNRRHPMRSLGISGIWEIFVPGIGAGEVYKFYIKSRYDNYEVEKSDPYGFYFEYRPKTAAIVYDINRYCWSDDEWVKKRSETNWLESPVSIYEAHLGSWMRIPGEGNRFLTYREFADTLIEYVKQMGYTHIELLAMAEHPLDASWGYQVIGYFAPTSRFGTPEDFMYFVDACHQNNIGVILDWAPAHFPKDGHGLGFFDGTALYEHQDPRKGEHKDWGTLIFNYGRNEVRNYLTSNALFWLEKYHIDGLRVDAVASMLYLDYSREDGQWVANIYGGRENLEAIDFIKNFNEITHQYFPGILTIAEESTAWPGVTKPVYLGGLGFDMKWNMGWMHDMIDYISKEPVHRKYHHNHLTFGLLYAFTENFVLVFSHDEVVYGKRSMLNKMPGDLWQKFANLRLFYGFMYGHPGKKLLFMGGEIGQWDEWNFEQSIDWHLTQYRQHNRLQKYVRDLNRLYASEPALYEVDFHYHGFDWIDFHDAENSIVSFIRYSKTKADYLVVVCNFTPVPRFAYRVGVPQKCYYREILNSDSREYWGSNLGNAGGVHAEDTPWNGKPCSVNIVIPPLSVLYFKPCG